MSRTRFGICVRISIIAIAPLVASVAVAQVPLTLSGALALARERNPDLAAAREGALSARAQQAVADQFPNPVLTATTTKIPSDGTSSRTAFGNGFFDRSYDSTLGVSQLFELGGKRRNRRMSAEEGRIQAQARIADAERTLISAVVRSYVAAVASREVARIGQESAESFQKSAELAVSREGAGDISRSDRTQVEIAAGRSRTDAASAEAAFRSALRSLGAILALPAGSEGELADTLDTLLSTRIELETPDETGALERRPDLKALEAAVRRAQADVLLQRSLRVPDPTVIAQYERQPPDQRNSIGLGIAIPIPVFNQNRGGIASAESALSGAKRELDTARLHARAELASTRDVLRAAEARANEYLGKLLPSAEEVRSSVEFAYAHGAASLLELFEAERNANEIRVAAAGARADLVAARADFAAARMLVFPSGAGL